jgi:hypothetical protein
LNKKCGKANSSLLVLMEDMIEHEKTGQLPPHGKDNQFFNNGILNSSSYAYEDSNHKPNFSEFLDSKGNENKIINDVYEGSKVSQSPFIAND